MADVAVLLFSTRGKERARCHVMRCSVGSPMWQEAEGILQPTMCEELRPWSNSLEETESCQQPNSSDWADCIRICLKQTVFRSYMKIEGIGIRKILPIYLPTAKRERKCFCDSVTSQGRSLLRFIQCPPDHLVSETIEKAIQSDFELDLRILRVKSDLEHFRMMLTSRHEGYKDIKGSKLMLSNKLFYKLVILLLKKIRLHKDFKYFKCCYVQKVTVLFCNSLKAELGYI
ncbi:uncharacterized protein LOC120618386 [Pteropus medius]|uniref:uncharacterized protein LOC120618386 n=1 Tax=Pteropus vampyrus TaxID=132908 RepID=UPI00196A41AA|nr:uncharacterized protein LOC120618386 [Pteropus giganteus]XP_039738496.1 uncharacterized protein LOC120618386 [Pteropus giganteus]